MNTTDKNYIELLEDIENFSQKIRHALSGGHAKSLCLILKKFGWRHRLRWIYQQGENSPDRESIIQRYLKFMCGLKIADYAAFEYLAHEIDIFLRSGMRSEFPILSEAEKRRLFSGALANLKALEFQI